jgi:hypothetical protein
LFIMVNRLRAGQPFRAYCGAATRRLPHVDDCASVYPQRPQVWCDGCLAVAALLDAEGEAQRAARPPGAMSPRQAAPEGCDKVRGHVSDPDAAGATPRPPEGKSNG